MNPSQPLLPQPTTATMSRCNCSRSFSNSLGSYIGKKCECVLPNPEEEKLINPESPVEVGRYQENCLPEVILPVITDPPTVNSQGTDVSGSSKESSVLEDRSPINDSYESAEGVEQDSDSKILNAVDDLTIQQYLKQVEEVFQVKIYEELGHGSYGKVYRCKSTQDSQQYAVKFMMSQYILPEDSRSEWEENVSREVKGLKDLQHDNVVDYYEHMFIKHNDYDVNCFAAIKTELLDCTLGNILEKRALNPKQVTLLTNSLAVVLWWMVNQGYAHHDIKPDNIMFKNLDLNAQDFDSAFLNAIPKITDLGFVHKYKSRTPGEAQEWSFGLGTPRYCSPEKMEFFKGIISGTRSLLWYNPFKSDAYAFGITLLWCLICKTQSKAKMKQSAINCLDKFKQDNPKVANSPLLTAIEQLIRPVANARIDRPDANVRIHVRDVIAMLKIEIL